MIRPYEPIRYGDPDDVHRPYDVRHPVVAREVIDLVRARLAAEDARGGLVEVEHVGSTAVPGCAGKGPVDLMLVYAPGRLPAIETALVELGFRKHVGPDPFPQDRPVFVGSYELDGESFRLHVHAIRDGEREVETQRVFRDRLREDPELVAQYVRVKRAVVRDGAADATAYNEGKAEFIQRVVRGDT